MTTFTRRRMVVALAAGLAILAAGAAEAQSRSGATTVTGPNGQTATRSYGATWDPYTGTYTRNSTVTGPNGYSRSVSGSGQAAPGQWSGSRTLTGPYGNSRTVTRSGQAAPGYWSRSRTVTGPYGGSRSVTRSVTRY